MEARRLLSEQAEIFPDSRLPPLGLAEVALRERRWNDAIAYAEESLARSSSIDAVAKYETALVLAPIRTARDRAVSLLRDVVEVAPNEPLPNVTLGELLELDGTPTPRSTSTELDQRGKLRSILTNFFVIRGNP